MLSRHAEDQLARDEYLETLVTQCEWHMTIHSDKLPSNIWPETHVAIKHVLRGTCRAVGEANRAR